MELTELEAGGAYEALDLSGYELSERDLSDARFTRCTLSDAQVSALLAPGARFIECRFVRCRFAHADFREANFSRCSFADSESHSGAQFAFSQLDQARFEACDLSFAEITRSSLWAVRFQESNLRGARFHRADFTRAFSGKTLHTAATFAGCNLELTDFSDAALRTCELAGSSLREADLQGADLEAADLTNCDLFQALTAGAKMAGADLRGAEVSGLDLTALASAGGMKVTLSQATALLSAMGLDVHAD